MKNKKKVYKEGGSLKTLFLYTLIVFFVILISLSIKAVFIIRQSKFNSNNIAITISQNNNVVAILGFNSANDSISLLKIKNGKISSSSVGRGLGLLADAKIESQLNLSEENTQTILTKAAFRTDSTKTDLTIFDILRLIFLSKSTTSIARKVQEIKLPMQDYDINKTVSGLFSDTTISSENISTEIVNATDEPGLGKRLERAFSNIGGNVIAISTSRDIQARSKIQYYGHRTYTLERLKNLLKFPVEKKENESIANIVIIIGEDSKSASAF